MLNTFDAAFFAVAAKAIRQEDRVLGKLLASRPGYASYVPGVYTLFEPALVYVVFKAHLSSKLAENWRLDWEVPSGRGEERIDLVGTRLGRGRPTKIGIEAKWWLSKGLSGVERDCDKLRACEWLSARRLLLLRLWDPAGGGWTLPELVQRNVARSRLSGVSMVCHKIMPTRLREGRVGELGVALVEVR